MIKKFFNFFSRWGGGRYEENVFIMALMMSRDVHKKKVENFLFVIVIFRDLKREFIYA